MPRSKPGQKQKLVPFSCTLVICFQTFIDFFPRFLGFRKFFLNQSRLLFKIFLTTPKPSNQMKRSPLRSCQSFMTAFSLLFVLITSLPLFTQESPMEWGNVPPPDILMTTYEADTSAEAVVLCDYAYVNIFTSSSDYGYYRYHHKRIKILKKSAFNRGDISIPFYFKEGLESIRNIKAQVISPVGKITALDKKDFFREDINEYWASINFSLPNLQEGSIFEYQYELHSKQMSELRTWYFQEDIPVRWSEYRVQNESYFSYALLFEGGEYMDKTPLAGGGTLLKKGDTKIRILNGRYIMENAPGLREEAYVTTMDDYRARIRFQLSEILRPGGYRETYMSTWEELADELLQDPYFGERFLKKRNFKKLVEAAMPYVEKANSEEEKIKATYDFIARQVSWDESYGIFTDRSLDDAFNTKKASAAEMNMMCLAILKHFDVEATPILTSTRGHGKMTETYPIRKQFNHLMVLVKIEGKYKILDAGDPLRPMGLPRVSALNKKAWMVDKENPSWITIEPILSKELLAGGLEVTPQGDIQVSLKASFYNYSAFLERSYFRDDPKADYWKERLNNDQVDVQIDSIKYQNEEEVDERFSTILHFTYPGAIDMESDRLYFSPVVFTNFRENPFKLKERSYPVDFPYLFEEKYMMSIKIPEGFEVEELPEKIDHQLSDGKGYFIFTIDKNGNNVQLISQLSISKLLYTPDEYKTIRDLFDLVVEKHGEQIVFRKKT